jgi:hypothetical protein
VCTLIIDLKKDWTVPLVIAANRDEFLTRPATPPHIWPGRGVLAPVDEQAHGTWLGLNRFGLFVGVTNRFGNPNVPTRESRGQLVLDALTANDAHGLHQRLSTLPPDRYNAFHLLYTDGVEAFVTWTDGTTLFQKTLGDGLHVVTERSLGGDDRARTELVTSRFPRRTHDGLPDFAAMERLLGTRRPDDPLGGVCVSVPGLPYGTRSSLTLALPTKHEEARWRWADGPPDVTPFVEGEALVKELFTR